MKTRLSSQEIQTMISQAACLRDKLIVTFLADTGCRVSEMLRVKVENIDLANRAVLIPHLKMGIKKVCPACGKKCGSKRPFCAFCGADIGNVKPQGSEDHSRLIDVGDSTVELMAEYIEGMASGKPLIGITRFQVYNIIRELAETAGIQGKVMLNPNTGQKHFVHCHTFRDSLASDWLEMAKGDITEQKALQTHLGHDRFDTTMRYFKLSPTEVKKIGDKLRESRGI